MSMWIVYDPTNAAIHGKYYSRKKAVEDFYCRRPNKPFSSKYSLVYEKVDMAYYSEWYLMVLLKSKNFSA